MRLKVIALLAVILFLGVAFTPNYNVLRDAIRPLQEEELEDFECPEDELLGIPLTFVNGSCHDTENPFEGRAGSEQKRLIEPTYVDSRSRMVENKPSPRVVSNAVVDQPEGLGFNIKAASRLLIFFGQFIDHDFALILEQEDEEEEGIAREEAPIEVPASDGRFTEEEMEFPRSEFELDNNFVRQFNAAITQWLDLGSVYGDTQLRSDMLRTFVGGRLRADVIDNAEYPPFDPDIMMPICGDIRCPENTMLFSWHTLFLRNHNYWAEEVLEEFPDLEAERDDEFIFQQARIRNIIEYQYLVWEQYLPYLLGRRTFRELTGPFQFSTEAEPESSLVLTTACFRYGHSGVANDLQFTDEFGLQQAATLAFADSFGNTAVVQREDLIAYIFFGQSLVPHDILDSRVVSGIRDELLANSPDRRDLAALNMQRGRDHGIGGINDYRREFGLPQYICPDSNLDCFTQMTGETEIATRLFELYGDINSVDFWVAGMAEQSFEDSLLGETFTRCIAEGFNNMRQADRIWYENVIGELSVAEAPVIFPIGLVDIVERNTGMRTDIENSFMLDPVWPAFVEGNRFQMEWYLPSSIRNDIAGYTITTTSSDPDEDTIVDSRQPGQLLMVFHQDATPNTEYTVSVMATLNDGSNVNIGQRTIVTGNGVRNELNVGLIVGLSVAGGILVIGAIVAIVIIKRRNATSFGGDTLLT